jgi:hypothetical protein
MSARVWCLHAFFRRALRAVYPVTPLRLLRVNRGLTQAELGLLADVPRHRIHLFERRLAEPTPTEVWQLWCALTSDLPSPPPSLTVSAPKPTEKATR